MVQHSNDQHNYYIKGPLRYLLIRPVYEKFVIVVGALSKASREVDWDRQAYKKKHDAS